MGYSFSRSITIDHTKCGASDSSNFPVLITGTYAYLATVANGGSVTSSSGFDIIFTSDVAGLTPLKFQRQLWTATTGQVAFNVKVPTVSHTSDTVIYIWYGNASVTTDQADIANTFSNSYAVVIQVTNSAGSPVVTDVLHAQGLGPQGAPTLSTSGPFVYAAVFNGSNYFNTTGTATNVAMPVGSAERTCSIWFWVSGSNGAFCGWGTNTTNQGFVPLIQSNFLKVNCYNTDTGTPASLAFTPDSAWHYFVATLPSGTSTIGAILVYLDGVNKAIGANANVLNTSNGDVILGGYEHDHTFDMTGRATEFRVRTVASTQDWITTEFNNQNSPSTFYTVGGAVAGGGLLFVNPGLDGGMRPQMKGGMNA